MPPDSSRTPRELMLEQIRGEEALVWVKEQNEKTIFRLQLAAPGFKDLQNNLLDQNANPTVIGNEWISYGWVYRQAYTDKAPLHGSLYRIPVEKRRQGALWQEILNLDELQKDEQWRSLARSDTHDPTDSWVLKNTCFLGDKFQKVLVACSLSGRDAEVVREFDLVTKQYVPGGFELEEGRSDYTWVDENRVLFGTDKEGTQKGYPRTVRLWTRGTPISAAQLLFSGAETDDSVTSWRTVWPGATYCGITQSVSKNEDKTYLLNLDDLSLTLIPIPTNASISMFHEKCIISLRTSWEVPNGPSYKRGSLISLNLDSIANPNGLKTHLIFEPTPTCVYRARNMIHNTLLITLINNLHSEIRKYHFENDSWQCIPSPLSNLKDVKVFASDSHTNICLINSADFLTPPSLYLYNIQEDTFEWVQKERGCYDLNPYETTQHFVMSKDGTQVPYFTIHRKDMIYNGRNPTVLEVYGGFANPITPKYLSSGKLQWLTQGGIIVYGNIRGGGEFGEAWYEGGVKENRQNSLDDFIAIAEDLIRREITSPAFLGIMGASNGGLVVGAIFTQRPELFAAVVCIKPLCDLLRYHTMLVGGIWKDEYGDPEDPNMRPNLEALSPYHNIKEGIKYPSVLIISSTDDDRVSPAHSRWMVNKMQTLGHEVLYYETAQGGHNSADPNQGAFQYALCNRFFETILKHKPKLSSVANLSRLYAPVKRKASEEKNADHKEEIAQNQKFVK